MKAVKFLTLIVLISSIGFVSCKKDEDPASPGTSNGSISLKYAGTAWNASLAVQAISTGGVINVTGSDSEARQAAVMLYGISSTGTYEITTGSAHQLRWTEGINPEQTYVASGILGSGTIVVTELTDAKIKGTFSFTGANTAGATKTISDGSFEGIF